MPPSLLPPRQVQHHTGTHRQSIQPSSQSSHTIHIIAARPLHTHGKLERVDVEHHKHTTLSPILIARIERCAHPIPSHFIPLYSSTTPGVQMILLELDSQTYALVPGFYSRENQLFWNWISIFYRKNRLSSKGVDMIEEVQSVKTYCTTTERQRCELG